MLKDERELLGVCTTVHNGTAFLATSQKTAL